MVQFHLKVQFECTSPFQRLLTEGEVICVLVELNPWLKVQVARMPASLLKLNLVEAMGLQNKYVIAWQD